MKSSCKPMPAGKIRAMSATHHSAAKVAQKKLAKKHRAVKY